MSEARDYIHHVRITCTDQKAFIILLMHVVARGVGVGTHKKDRVESKSFQ